MPKSTKHRFKVWQSPKDGQFYWHVQAKNGRIIADGAEGYETRAGAVDGFMSLAGAITEGRIYTEQAGIDLPNPLTRGIEVVETEEIHPMDLDTEPDDADDEEGNTED